MDLILDKVVLSCWADQVQVPRPWVVVAVGSVSDQQPPLQCAATLLQHSRTLWWHLGC